MASKEQERKALEQIKAIIESVGGEDSYIGMAFRGCFKIAETNIENDFGNSLQDSLDYERQCLAEVRDDLYETQKAYNLMVEKNRDQLEKIKGLEFDFKELARKLEKEQEQTYKTYEAFVKEKEERERIQVDSEIEIDRLNQEIIVLKAKLYDLISQ